MGYYTRFELEWKYYKPTIVENNGFIYATNNCPHTEDIRKIIKTFSEKSIKTCPFCSSPIMDLDEIIAQEILQNENMNCALDSDGSSNDATKWYEWSDDMLKLSKKYPNVFFTLSGNGEDNGDIWKAYFLNGKSQIEKATFTINPFDEKKLK